MAYGRMRSEGDEERKKKKLRRCEWGKEMMMDRNFYFANK